MLDLVDGYHLTKLALLSVVRTRNGKMDIRMAFQQTRESLNQKICTLNPVQPPQEKHQTAGSDGPPISKAAWRRQPDIIFGKNRIR